MSAATVIVGASSEIGGAVAERLARRGGDVHLWGRDARRLERTRLACERAGARCTHVTVVDVTNAEHLHAAAAAALVISPHLTELVWAAGQFQWGSFDTVDLDATLQLLGSTLTAAVATTRLLLPALIASAPSAVVFIGSGAGRQAFRNNAAYVAAKHGLRGFAEALHLDLATQGLTVATITAGLVDAGAGRLAPAVAEHPDGVLRPDDIARAVQFVLDSPPNVRPTEIVLQPALHP